MAAACGDLHTLLLFEDGQALSCGLGESGRLGLPVPKGEDGVGCVTTPREVPLHALPPSVRLALPPSVRSRGRADAYVLAV